MPTEKRSPSLLLCWNSIHPSSFSQAFLLVLFFLKTFTNHISSILHLSLVLQDFLKVERFVSDLQLFPRTYSYLPKSQITVVNYQEVRKMYLLFLYSTYGEVTANDHRDYVTTTSRAEKGAAHSHVIHFFPF